jgi:hypothetical protein
MTDVGRRQFLSSTLAVATVAFSDTALGSDAAFEQRGPRGEWNENTDHWIQWSANTEDQMHEEMRCWVGGIEDLHDRIIRQVRLKVWGDRGMQHLKPERIAAYEANVEATRQAMVDRFTGGLTKYEYPRAIEGHYLACAELEERGLIEQTRGPEEWREIARTERARWLRELDFLTSVGDRRETAGALFLDEQGDFHSIDEPA